MRGSYSTQGITHLERTFAATRDAPPLLRGRALQTLGILRSQRGDERAEATFREGLATFRAADDQARVAVALNSLGVMARDRRDEAAARAALEEAIDAYRSLDDRRRLADSLSNLADEEQLDEAAAIDRYVDAFEHSLRSLRQPTGEPPRQSPSPACMRCWHRHVAARAESPRIVSVDDRRAAAPALARFGMSYAT